MSKMHNWYVAPYYLFFHLYYAVQHVLFRPYDLSLLMPVGYIILEGRVVHLYINYFHQLITSHYGGGGGGQRGALPLTMITFWTCFSSHSNSRTFTVACASCSCSWRTWFWFLALRLSTHDGSQKIPSVSSMWLASLYNKRLQDYGDARRVVCFSARSGIPAVKTEFFLPIWG